MLILVLISLLTPKAVVRTIDGLVICFVSSSGCRVLKLSNNSVPTAFPTFLGYTHHGTVTMLITSMRPIY